MLPISRTRKAAFLGYSNEVPQLVNFHRSPAQTMRSERSLV
jgi:hypothetical protein